MEIRFNLNLPGFRSGERLVARFQSGKGGKYFHIDPQYIKNIFCLFLYENGTNHKIPNEKLFDFVMVHYITIKNGVEIEEKCKYIEWLEDRISDAPTFSQNKLTGFSGLKCITLVIFFDPEIFL